MALEMLQGLLAALVHPLGPLRITVTQSTTQLVSVSSLATKRGQVTLLDQQQELMTR